MNRILKTIGVISIAALAVACGDDDEDTTDENPSGMTNDNTDNTNDNSNMVTNPSAGSVQQAGFDAGLFDTVDASGLSITSTLAVTGTFDPAAPATALPTGFEEANYFGAVDPSVAEGSAWWQGWTYIDTDLDGGLPGAADFHPLQAEIEGGDIAPATDNACASDVNSDFTDGGRVTIFGQSFPVCVINGDITTDTTFVNSHVFVMADFVNIGDGFEAESTETNVSNVTVTIPAGTQIYAAEGSAISFTATRGSEIVANGTAAQPIIFGAVTIDTDATNVITGDVTDLSGRGGQWGGVVLSGFGVTSSGDANGEVSTEAAPADAPRFYGGSSNTDSSGSLRYVIIAESGFQFAQDAEVQGLTVEAAGSGTVIDFVQIVASNDDCVEWFGGAADASHLICNGVQDDGLDIDEGYVGNIQFAIVRLGEFFGEHGIESDGKNDLTPFTAPNIANLTVLGNAAGGDTAVGALHRENFQGTVYRSVFIDDLLAGGAFEAGCLDIDDDDTVTENGGADMDSAIRHFDSVFSCNGGNSEGLAPNDD